VKVDLKFPSKPFVSLQAKDLISQVCDASVLEHLINCDVSLAIGTWFRECVFIMFCCYSYWLRTQLGGCRWRKSWLIHGLLQMLIRAVCIQCRCAEDEEMTMHRIICPLKTIAISSFFYGYSQWSKICLDMNSFLSKETNSSDGLTNMSTSTSSTLTSSFLLLLWLFSSLFQERKNQYKRFPVKFGCVSLIPLTYRSGIWLNMCTSWASLCAFIRLKSLYFHITKNWPLAGKVVLVLGRCTCWWNLFSFVP
jgi:hypothetical protein